MSNTVLSKDQNQEISKEQKISKDSGTGSITSIDDLKTEIYQLQDELNKFGIYQTIRSEHKANQLQYQLKATTYQVIYKDSSKELTSNSTILPEPVKDVNIILKSLSVGEVTEGLTKAYELISTTEILLNKIMEYQFTSLLNYEERYEDAFNFSAIKENQAESQSKVFFVTKRLLERLNQACERVVHLEKGNKTNAALQNKSIETLEQLALQFEAGEHLGIPEKLTNELRDLIKHRKSTSQLKEGDDESKLYEREKLYSSKETKWKETAEIYQEQLKSALADNSRIREQQITSVEFERRIKYYEEQNAASALARQRSDFAEVHLRDENLKLKFSENRLKSEIAQLSKTIEELSQIPTKKSTSTITSKYASGNNETPEYYLNIVGEIETEYEEKLVQHRELVSALEKENYDLRTEVDNLKKDQAEKAAEIEKLQHEYKSSQPQEDSFENALAEETEMMKAAFQVKIKKLQDELAALKKKYSEDVIDLKSNLQKEQETKDLLLKKLQIQGKV